MPVFARYFLDAPRLLAYGAGQTTAMGSLKGFLLAWLGLIAAIILVALFIPTDAKRVHRVLQAAEQAVRAGDIPGLMSHIAADYHYQQMDRPLLEQLARAIFHRNQFPHTVLYNEKIQVRGERAEARFAVAVQPQQGSAIPGPHRTSWRLTLQRREKNWLITEIELLTVNGQPLGTLRQAMELAAAIGKE